METPPIEATIRRCLYRDLDRILAIYNIYVSRSIVSLDQDSQTMPYMQNLYNSVLDQDLPFLVVTLNKDHKEEVLGYAYASYFRQLPAFSGTVEMFIYLDPDATGQGIGKNLLTVLMEMLRSVRPGPGREQGIREVLAVVPVEEGRDASRYVTARAIGDTETILSLGGFFLKQNFVDRGSLKRVGWKMGRWVDTRYLQRSLDETRREQERSVQTERAPTRRWWSSLFRRRRRRSARWVLKDSRNVHGENTI